jgi:hypothetical protein
MTSLERTISQRALDPSPSESMDIDIPGSPNDSNFVISHNLEGTLPKRITFRHSSSQADGTVFPGIFMMLCYAYPNLVLKGDGLDGHSTLPFESTTPELSKIRIRFPPLVSQPFVL